MKWFLALFLMLLPVAASAQEGSVRFDRAVQYDFELPPEREDLRDMIPSESITSMVLLFSASESLTAPAPTDESGEESDNTPRMQMFLTRLKMRSGSRSDHETLLEAHVRYEDGAIAEAREFMGRTFLISGTRPAYAWKLTGEQSEFLGYMVQKATTVQDSMAIEAWFTPQIPVPAGPGPFGGLPGMILVVSVDDGHMVYSATEVELEGLEDDAISAPDNGREVTRAEYEKIVAEKMSELEARRRGRRDRGRRRDR